MGSLRRAAKPCWLRFCGACLLVVVMSNARAQSPRSLGESSEPNPVRVDGLLQFRYTGVFDAEDADSGNDDYVGGFSVARARIGVKGEVADSRISYRISGQFGAREGDFRVNDGYVDLGLAEGWSLRLGQFKLPFTREFDVSPTKLVLVDRSLSDALFRGGRTQGISLGFRGDRIRVRGTIGDGRLSRNTQAGDAREADSTALTARFDLRLGDAPWSEYTDMSSFRGRPVGTLLGAAAHWQRDGIATTLSGLDDGTVDLLGYTADASIEGNGWSAAGSFFGQTFDDGETSLTDLAFSLQGAAFVTEKIELAARTSVIFPDDDRANGGDAFSQTSLGINVFMIPESHAVKFSCEVSYFPEDQVASGSLVGAALSNGVLADSDEHQFAVIAQMQIVF